MRQSDLEFLLQLESNAINNHKRLLQDLQTQKETLITKRDTMNRNFLLEKADIHSINYTTFHAIENQRINQQIDILDKEIATTQDAIRDCVQSEKKYDILKQEIITARTKKHEQYQQNQSDEYTIFKYNKLM
jgi:hypothetical protein